jgi:acyl-CoA synthetase (AMP-forming)/AMP-acid ligase II
VGAALCDRFELTASLYIVAACMTDEYGYLEIVDRVKDFIKSGGEWISSVEVENILMARPALNEACVFGIPRPKWQERPVAERAEADDARLSRSRGLSARWLRCGRLACSRFTDDDFAPR